jgi:hypothetical protein
MQQTLRWQIRVHREGHQPVGNERTRGDQWVEAVHTAGQHHRRGRRAGQRQPVPERWCARERERQHDQHDGEQPGGQSHHPAQHRPGRPGARLGHPTDRAHDTGGDEHQSRDQAEGDAPARAGVSVHESEAEIRGEQQVAGQPCHQQCRGGQSAQRPDEQRSTEYRPEVWVQVRRDHRHPVHGVVRPQVVDRRCAGFGEQRQPVRDREQHHPDQCRGKHPAGSEALQLRPSDPARRARVQFHPNPLQYAFSAGDQAQAVIPPLAADGNRSGTFMARFVRECCPTSVGGRAPRRVRAHTP